ncbi:hypothetical protein BJ165DRAFT_1467385 [Panaeolus papilionaceus]|nr:hypothetical protein BJ165DRAFT_1467385 [Panaeolus papilionaceus]
MDGIIRRPSDTSDTVALGTQSNQHRYTQGIARRSEINALRLEVDEIKQQMTTFAIHKEAPIDPRKSGPTEGHQAPSRGIGLAGAAEFPERGKGGHESEVRKETRDAESYELEIKRNMDLVQMQKRLEVAEANEKRACDALKFVAKADLMSITELKKKVIALNDEIFRAAASFRETITHQAHNLTEEDNVRWYGEVVELIGEPIALMVSEEGKKLDAKVDPLLAQVVLQIFLTKVCASKIDHWIPVRVNFFFKSSMFFLNFAIISIEEPAVSGRWRALTQTHTRPLVAGWKENLIENLMKIFKVAGWRTPDKEYHLQFKRKLESIFKAVQDLRIAMGEKITSTDIRLSLVPPNSQFIDSWMEDALAGAYVEVIPQVGGPIQCVFGTTEMGLRKVIVGQQDSSGEVMFESMLSPKVVVESTLRDALRPRNPSTGRLYTIDSMMCGK